MTWSWLAALPIAYLFGAIPVGVIAGRLRGIDVTAVGSGNIGATNVWRVLGPKAGTAVFMLDAAKGGLAVYIGKILLGQDRAGIAVCAALAVIGHSYSVFLKFKGGKGIATAFGALLVIVPIATLGCFLLWGLVLLATRTISVASITACVAAPLGLYLSGASVEYCLVVILLATVALIKHIPNMQRLIKGTEPRIGNTNALDTRPMV